MYVQAEVNLFFLDASGVPGGGKKAQAFHWVAHFGAAGVFGVALIDSTIIPLAIPGSTDLLLLWLVGNGGNPYILGISAVVGSLIGGYTTWRLGKKGGEAALTRYVPKRLQKRVQGWSQNHSILALVLPAMLPPPVPLWPFLLAAGALGATWKRFLLAFGGGRCIRWAVVVWLAVRYGKQMIKWYSDTLSKWSEPIIWTLVGVTILGMAYSLWKLRRIRREVAREQSGAQAQAAA